MTATNLPSGFDGAAPSAGAPINYPATRSPLETIYTKAVNGHELKARLTMCVREKGAYATLHLDGVLQATLIFEDRGRAFCERVLKGALMGMASRVGKHVRQARNKARRAKLED